MIREIYTYPHWVLNTQTQKIQECNKDIINLARDMQETMYYNNGIGLAVPQVGETCQIITVDVENTQNGLITLINPRILEKRGSVESEEACLSLPGFKLKVNRAEEVLVAGLDLEERKKEMHASGLLAICLQHEIDHLNGKTLLDHASKLKRNMYEKKIQKWKKSNH